MPVTQSSGIATDATYVYVIDSVDHHVYVYRKSDGSRTTGMEFDLAAANANPAGISVYDDYAYVVDATDHHVYVYYLVSEEVTNRDAAVTGSAGTPTASIEAEAQDLNRDAALSAAAGTPTASVAAEVESIAVTNRDAEVAARAGDPTATIQARRQRVRNRNARVTARAGAPTAVIVAEAADINVDAAVSAQAGDPTASIAAEAVRPPVVITEYLGGPTSGALKRPHGPLGPLFPLRNPYRPREKVNQPPQDWPGSLPEWLVFEELVRIGLEPGLDFIYQSEQFGGRAELGGAVVDFLLPYRFLGISVIGVYWHVRHNGGAQSGRDIIQRIQMASLGYTLIFVDDEALLLDTQTVVADALEGRDTSVLVS